MKKVFIVHGYGGSPNGGWRPWLMGELEKMGVYACALAMPSPDRPVCKEWTEEIARHIPARSGDDFYLVGHSLGVPAILRYLESAGAETPIRGAVLVAGPLDDVGIRKIEDFFQAPFDFEKIKQRVSRFTVIHGDDDEVVPLNHAEILTKELGADLIIIPGGGHLTGSEGQYALPQAAEALRKLLGQ